MNVGGYPSTIAVKPVTNRVYVEIGRSTIGAIDGDPNATSTGMTVIDGATDDPLFPLGSSPRLTAISRQLT